MQTFPKKQLLNSNGSDYTDLIWSGNQTGLLQLNLTYNNDLLRIGAIAGLDQFWRPESVNLIDDINTYKELGKLKNIYNSFLAYLTFLDSIQVANIPVIQYQVTCPKVRSALTVQAMQEVIHTQSYQHMILSLVPESERNSIYELVITDQVLNQRCQFIANYYQAYIDNKTTENYYLALVANYILEGLYFYAGFMFFYSISNLMPGTADMIKLIHKDEQLHVKLFESLIKQASQEFDNVASLQDTVYEMFDQAVKQEYNWFNYISKNELLGMNDISMDKYLKHLANLRLKNINFKPLYDNEMYKNNPYKYLDKIADTGSEAFSKGDFFGSNVTSYNIIARDYTDF